ncbi:MAG TPA: hypothetical protein VL068_02900 [Microthrixaceae bacterium]|nr:hypothetical protein [Microthrixaceae bacterium]
MSLLRRAARPLLLVGVLAVTLFACSDLLSADKPDAVVKIEADGTKSVDEIRKEVKDNAKTWNGVRVAEDTTDTKKMYVEFTLPGTQLDTATSELGRVGGEAKSTKIDVDEEKLSDTPSTKQSDGTEASGESGRVRLRVEITDRSGSSGLTTVLGAAMLLFSIIGLITSIRWSLRKLGLGSRSDGTPRSRRVERPDLDLDPPTQETPVVPPQPY